MANLYAEIVTDRSTEHRLSSRSAIARVQGGNIVGQVEIERYPQDETFSIDFYLAGGSHSSIDAQKIATVELTAQHEIKGTLGTAMLTACAVTKNSGELVGVWGNGLLAIRAMVDRKLVKDDPLDDNAYKSLHDNSGEYIENGYHFRPIQLNS